MQVSCQRKSAGSRLQYATRVEGGTNNAKEEVGKGQPQLLSRRHQMDPGLLVSWPRLAGTLLLTWIIHRDNERRGKKKNPIKGLNLHPKASSKALEGSSRVLEDSCPGQVS